MRRRQQKASSRIRTGRTPQGDHHDPQGQGCLAGNRSGRERALTTDSGVLSSSPYGFKTRFENEPGANPAELIAAAHTGCFTMALAFQLQTAGFTPDSLTTEAAVSLDSRDGGFTITKSALTLTAKVPGLDQATFAELAGVAVKTFQVSCLLNAEITLDATLG